MSTSASAAPAEIIDPPINLDPPASERQLGLPTTTALVVGNMIGAGIFLVPTVLAPFGMNAMYGWAVAIVGALFLAVTLAKLSAHIQGGPFVYVEEAFGRELAFAVMWSYLVSVWVANAILAVAAVSNFSHIAPSALSNETPEIPIGSSPGFEAVHAAAGWLIQGLNLGPLA